MLISKKNRREVYKYLFNGACPGGGGVWWGSAEGGVARGRRMLGAGHAGAGARSHPLPPPSTTRAEGVLFAEKDFNLPKHPELDVPNLEVIKLMQSFKSKEYVTERYAWRHYYWCARAGGKGGRCNGGEGGQVGATGARAPAPSLTPPRPLPGS